MTRKPPENCATMVELRQEIDALDAELVGLLSKRATYIDRAITLKQGEHLPARITERVNEVIEKVRGTAETRDLDPDLAEQLWVQLIDWSITREEKVLGEHNAK